MNSKFAAFFSVIENVVVRLTTSCTAGKWNFYGIFRGTRCVVAANDQQPKDENRT
jgi:hypothetical protein